MSEIDGKSSTKTFKKRAHRPWKSDLLESTIEEATLDISDDLFALDLNADKTTPQDSFFPEFNFTDDTLTSSVSTSIATPLTQATEFDFEEPLDLDDPLNLDDPNQELKHNIRQTQQQKKLLVRQISDKSHSSILLGGFLQPQQVTASQGTIEDRKISSMLKDLESSEKKLSLLTRDLEISKAIERAEQAELTKKAATHGRHAAENRMRQAIEQASVAAEQFRTAMDQANQAAFAHQEEARLRKAAEVQAKEARLRANNVEIELQNERLARLAAEEKAQHAFNNAERANSLQKQLQETSEQLAKTESKRLELQNKFDELHIVFTKMDQEHKVCSNNIYKLETTLRDLTEKTTANEKKITELEAQREKLKTIIASEQDLRKIAERKLNETLEKATKAEQGWEQEIQQRKIIEERAKRAVAHASRTVMHLLNAPADNEFNMGAAPGAMTGAAPEKIEKAKIKVPATADVYDYEADDFSF